MKFFKAARPVIMGQNGMLCAGHPLASLAGIRVLQEGGNAVDAALAAAFVMAVVKPEASGCGGDLFALVYMKKTGKVEALNSSGPAPAKATIDFFCERGLRSIPQFGPLSIAVPGAVDGWLELHRKYATKELARLMSDAIGIARAGFPISQEFAESIAECSQDYSWVDRCYKQPLGTPEPGKILAQKGLSEVLEKIAQRGRDGLYGGEVAEKICATIQSEGGILSEEDLRTPNAEWLEPLNVSYRDTNVFEQPPVSQGFMVLEMLNIIESWPMHNGTMSRADMIHHQVAAKKLAFEDRIRYLEDPKFGDPRTTMLVSKAYAAKRRAEVEEVMRRVAAPAGLQSSDTTYLCAADRDGNAISFIQSVFAGFGSRIIGGDTGVVMNNRLCSFGLDPSKANALRPGKRPAHTLNTYMVFQNGEVFAIGGSPGADDQPQTNLQIIHDLVDLEMDPQSAVEAPRWSHQPGTPPRDQLPEALRIEAGYDEATIDGLRKKGHQVNVVDRWSFGSAKIIVCDQENGCWLGGADPRRLAYALGY